MAVCKAASRGCNQNPWRTPMNYVIFCKALNSQLATQKKSTPSHVLFKDFEEKILEHPWQLLQKYLFPCKGENLLSEKSKALKML